MPEVKGLWPWPCSEPVASLSHAALSHVKAPLAPSGRAVVVHIHPRGPATAWEIYRLSTRRDWLGHRVSDRFFSREELARSCQTLFPGCRIESLRGPRALLAVVRDAPSRDNRRRRPRATNECM